MADTSLLLNTPAKALDELYLTKKGIADTTVTHRSSTPNLM